MNAMPGSLTVADLAGYPVDAEVTTVDGTVYLRRTGGYKPSDLDALPDDGRRHELLDGVIVVSPSPGRPHQRGVVELLVALRAAVPADVEVLVAPFDVALGLRTIVEPDVLVLPRDEAEPPVPPPLLAIEILSPRNRRHDLVAKRHLYEQAGVRSYWILDPRMPSLLALELDRSVDPSGRYVEVANPVGDAVAHLRIPVRPDGASVDVAFRPSDLV